MLPETAAKENAKLEAKGSPLRWRAGAMKRYQSTRMKGLIPVLRVLDCEGFGEEAANLVVRWFRQSMHPKAVEAMDRHEEIFSRAMAEQPAEVRLATGRFIAKKVGAAFNAGVRIGLAAGLHKRELNLEEESEAPA